MNCTNKMMLGAFSIKHLDILSYAEIVPAIMQKQLISQRLHILKGMLN